MNTKADKSTAAASRSGGGDHQENRGRTSAESIASFFQFTDDRQDAVVQKKMHEAARNSSRIARVKMFQPPVSIEPAVAVTQKKPLPENLRSGIQHLSGYSMDDVTVHYNSGKPDRMDAHAFAQGTDIHLASGQEKHLAHEAWHVVQQKQGRVKPTLQTKQGEYVNNDRLLENESDEMGRKALRIGDNVDPESRNIGGKPFGIHEKAGSLNVPADIFQLTEKKTVKGGKCIDVKDDDVKNLAEPFQLAAVQFDAKYDINVYHDEIEKYVNIVSASGKVPVIELRYFDAAFDDSIIGYEKEVRNNLKNALKGGKEKGVYIQFALLRDETAGAGGLVDEKGAIEDLQKRLADAAPLDTTGKWKKFQGPGEPKASMLKGKMMVPLVEESIFSQLAGRGQPGLAELEAITTRGADKGYSLHHNAMAALILENLPKASNGSSAAKITTEPAGASGTGNASGSESKEIAGGSAAGAATATAAEVELPRSRVKRSNSIVRPHTLTITNLVTGNDIDTANSVVKACHEALRVKHAKNVILVVEVKRLEAQLKALDDGGFIVLENVDVDANKAGRAQQSGIAMSEPSADGNNKKKIPAARKKLTIALKDTGSGTATGASTVAVGGDNKDNEAPPPAKKSPEALSSGVAATSGSGIMPNLNRPLPFHEWKRLPANMHKGETQLTEAYNAYMAYWLGH